MENKYYAVTVKLGHVGQHKFIIKTVPIKAESGKVAAYKARWMGRVKHHAKDAIFDVKEINEEQFKLLLAEKKADPYFHCKNIQQQRMECVEIEEETMHIDDDIDYENREKVRKNKVIFKNKKNKNLRNECIYMMRNYELAMVY